MIQIYLDCNWKASSWLEAFEQLITYIEHLQDDRKVIFLDELPWLDTARSKFIQALEYFWNGWASARHDIVLVVCGSATSWMIDMLINNHGGLHNRLTYKIMLGLLRFVSVRSISYLETWNILDTK